MEIPGEKTAPDSFPYRSAGLPDAISSHSIALQLHTGSGMLSTSLRRANSTTYRLHSAHDKVGLVRSSFFVPTACLRGGLLFPSTNSYVFLERFPVGVGVGLGLDTRPCRVRGPPVAAAMLSIAAGAGSDIFTTVSKKETWRWFSRGVSPVVSASQRRSSQIWRKLPDVR